MHPNVHLYYFDWNDIAFNEFNLSGHTIGPLADEVEKVFPELIKEYKGFKGINMNSLVNHPNNKLKYLFSHYLDFNINKLADDTGIKIVKIISLKEMTSNIAVEAYDNTKKYYNFKNNLNIIIF